MMNLEGYEVKHKAFGDGVISRADEKYVTVRFANAEKTFVYPDAFNGFMTLTDATASEAVAADVAASLAAKNAEAENRAREREMQMSHGIVIPGSRIPAEPRTDFPAEDDSGDDM